VNSVLLAVELGDARRPGVGSDRLLPIADAREDMRRHVLRMRRRRRNRGIALGRVEPLLGDRRVVVEMDQIVSDTGMARLAPEDWLQDGGPFELICVRLVVGRGGDVERDRMADLGFVVVGIALRQRLHRFQVGLHALAEWNSIVILVHGEQGIDVVTLALRLGAERATLFQCSEPRREILRRRLNVRIVEKAERDAPIRHSACRIGRKHLLEKLLGLAVPERMLVAHGAIEAPLRDLAARGGKVDPAESLVAGILGEDRLGCGQTCRRRQNNCSDCWR
jgi:hypothetical protein